MHSQVRWIFNWQGRIVVFAFVLAGLAGGLHAALSALAGGSVGILGGAAYVWRALRSGCDPGRAYRGQVLGETYKFAVSVLLFGFLFVGYRDVEPVPLFVTYALTLVVYWAALLRRC